MCERQCAVIRVFGLRRTNMSAYVFHTWIYALICLNCQEATMVHIDGSNRQVHINFRVNGRMHNMLNSTGGQVEYQHSNCEMSAFRIITSIETGVIRWATYDIMVAMIQATLIMRARCDGVGRRRHPCPTQHLSAYSVEGDRKYTASPQTSNRGQHGAADRQRLKIRIMRSIVHHTVGREI